MTKQEFLKEASETARRSSALSGLPAGITVAQAILESNWGQSQLARDSNNYFGIKAHPGHERVAYPTFEVVNGRTVRLTADFARYASMQDSFDDRDRLILRLACYAEARAAKGYPEQFARALAKRWATDPKYADKLLSVYHANHLDEVDIKISTEHSEK